MITVSGGGSLTSPPGGHTGSSRGGSTGNHQQQCTGLTSLSGNCVSGTQSQSGTSVGTYHTFNDMEAVTCTHSISPLHSGYDWECEENKIKWRGIFAKGTSEKPLKKVLSKALFQMYQTPHANNLPGEISQMTAVDEAWDYVESLLIKLLAMLTARPLPASKVDVEVILFKIDQCLRNKNTNTHEPSNGANYLF